MSCCFPSTIKETPLTRAVLNNDIETICTHGMELDAVLETNSIGFNALEIARYLNKREVLKLFDKDQSIDIKIKSPNNSGLTHYTRSDFEEAFGLTYLSHLYFPSYALFIDCIKNPPWIIKYGASGDENCKLGKRFYNEITQGFLADLSIQWIDNTLGYGVFAETAIEDGAYIGEYTGLIRRLSRFKPDPNAYCFHYPTRWWSLKYTVIDALHEGNILRFVNHSDIANIKPFAAYDRGLLHTIFLAKRPIKKGEQLVFNYGEDYWMKRNQIQLDEQGRPLALS